MRKRIVIILGLIAAITPVTSYGQWPTDPLANMMVAAQNGEETTPKVAVLSDGGYYVAWYDRSSGDYVLRLQRYDVNGLRLWIEEGLLISSHPQETWITDYDLAVDVNDNAIIVFNDLRDSTHYDWDIYAYKIAPAGTFLWGPDGIALSQNNYDEFDARVTITTAGNIVFCWFSDDSGTMSIHVRKVDPNGIDLWQNPAIKTLTAQYGVTISRLAPSDLDAVVVQALVQTTPEFVGPKDIYLFKFAADGSHAWNESGVLVSDAGGIGIWMKPQIAPDGVGGIYCFWYDARFGNEVHAYVQHILRNGTIPWPEDGIRLSNAFNQMEYQPVFVFLPDYLRTILVYEVTDMNQFLSGINAQSLDIEGNRLWGETGKVLVPLDSLWERMQPTCSRQENGALVTYLEASPQQPDIKILKAMRIDLDGNPVWPDTTVDMSSWQCDRRFPTTAVNYRHQILAVWSDSRNDFWGDLYLQNINPDGTLGPYITSIDDDRALPEAACMIRNYPNPFNIQTMFTYRIPVMAEVAIEIYDIAGRRVEKLNLGRREAGEHEVVWDATGMRSGMYLCVIHAGGHSASVKALLLK